jgi:hypothetical protein
MSVRLHIGSGQQLFIVHADGEVTTEEIDAVLDALQGSAVAGYRKPFDATLATIRMDAQELLAIGVGMKALQTGLSDRWPLCFRNAAPRGSRAFWASWLPPTGRCASLRMPSSPVGGSMAGRLRPAPPRRETQERTCAGSASV